MQIVLIQAVSIFFKLLYYLIFARVILSWIPMSRSNQIIQLLYALTEPILAPIRALLDRSPLGGMMLDFSAFIALILLMFVREIVIYIIYAIGML